MVFAMTSREKEIRTTDDKNSLRLRTPLYVSCRGKKEGGSQSLNADNAPSFYESLSLVDRYPQYYLFTYAEVDKEIALWLGRAIKMREEMWLRILS